jgi:hypothetical protein
MCSKLVGAVGLCEAPKYVYVGVCWRGSGCSVHYFVMFPDLDDEDTVIPFFSSRFIYTSCVIPVSGYDVDLYFQFL